MPKLEGMRNVTRSTRLMGAPYQWTSDITERCHITHVKTPYRRSNHHNFHEQCVRFMDCAEKVRLFGLYTALVANGTSLINTMIHEATEFANHFPQDTWLSQVLPPGEFSMDASGRSQPSTLFSKSRCYQSNDCSITFTVTLRPHQCLTVADAASLFRLPDLHAAIGDFLSELTYAQRNSQRKSSGNCFLPFTQIHIWHNFQMQQRSAQDTRIILPSCTVQALPPSFTMPYGRGNTVLVRDASGSLTSSDTDPWKVTQICMVFTVAIPLEQGKQLQVFFYGESFKFSNQHRTMTDDGDHVFIPAPGIDMFIVDRHMRSNRTRMGDIYCLSAIREIVELVPHFGQRMRDDVHSNNSLDVMDSFYINNFSDKETFHAILSY